MTRRHLLVFSVVAGALAAVLVGVVAGAAVGTGVFALLDLGSGPNSPIRPWPILFSGPSVNLTRGPPRPRPRIRPETSDVPFWFPDYRDLLSITTIDKLADWISQGDGQWNQLGRTLAATPAIAALGLVSYLESTIRGLGTPG